MAQVRVTNRLPQDYPLTIHTSQGMETVIIKGRGSRVFEASQLPEDMNVKVAKAQLKVTPLA